MNNQCQMCEKPLAAIDTYGDYMFPLCWDCLWWWQDEEKAQAVLYRPIRLENAEFWDMLTACYRTVPMKTYREFSGEFAR